MQVPRPWVYTTHTRTYKCQRGEERKRRREELQWIRRAGEVLFSVGGNLLGSVEKFKCLGRVLDKSDNDWPALCSNLEKTRDLWGRFWGS